MLLGPAPHLDKQYTIFGLVRCAVLCCAVLCCAAVHHASCCSVLRSLGRVDALAALWLRGWCQSQSAVALPLQVTEGLDTLAKLEELPTRKEGG